MIVLNSQIPISTPELAACLRALLAQAIVTGEQTVKAIGPFPAVQTLTIDVTGAIPLNHPAAKWSTEAGHVLGEFSVAELKVIGQPFGTGAREVQMEANARDCRGQFVQLGGEMALRFAAAKNGTLRASVSRANAEAILLAHATDAAQAHGVEIKGVQISWRTDGPRSLSAEVLIKAKKGFFPVATLKVRGQLKIDESLTATLFGLSVDGEGMVGSIGAGLIRPKLMQAEGMKRSLLGLPLDALSITNVHLTSTPDALTVEATFEG